MSGLTARFTESVSGFRAGFRNRNLRLLELAWSGSVVVHYGYAVGLAVFAYQAGGSAAVGLVYLLRMLLAAIASPFASVLGDRYPRIRVMLASDLVRTGLTAAGRSRRRNGCARGPRLRALRPGSGRRYRLPACSGGRAALALQDSERAHRCERRRDHDRRTRHVRRPAPAGLLLAFTGTTAIFAASALSFLWSAVLLLRIDSPSADSSSPAFGPSGRRAASGSPSA